MANSKFIAEIQSWRHSLVVLGVLAGFAGATLSCEPLPPKDGTVPLGESCLESQCSDGAFCQFEDKACDDSEIKGICSSIETNACGPEVAPVCGCDDKTYGNRCEAEAEAINVLHVGACENDALPKQVEIRSDCEAIQDFADPFTFEFDEDPWEFSFIRRDTAKLKLGWSGGCTPHEIYLCWDETFEPLDRTSPEPDDESSSVKIMIHHDMNDDTCEAHVIQNFEIDLTPIKDARIQQSGVRHDAVRLEFASAADPQHVRATIRYEF